ncbi:MAG: HprK-related kinase A [Alphaproteobacteria bacterium]
MRVADLSAAELARRLRGPGLTLPAGPFTVRLTSPLDDMAAAIARLYGGHALLEGDGSETDGREDAGYADFHLRIAPTGGIRRWIRPRIGFVLDGRNPFNYLPANQAFPMYEWGLNWCIVNLAHQYLIIHAAVVARDGRALLLPGPPGSGKSTLCAALIHRGWRLLSDELTLISPDDGRLTPLVRPVNLKNDSIAIMRAFAPNAVFNRETPDTAKGVITHMRPPDDSIAAASETAMPAWIVFPTFRAGAPARLAPVPGPRAFMRLADESFNYGLHGETGFEIMSRLVRGCAIHEMDFGDLDSALATLDGLAETAS